MGIGTIFRHSTRPVHSKCATNTLTVFELHKECPHIPCRALRWWPRGWPCPLSHLYYKESVHWKGFGKGSNYYAIISTDVSTNWNFSTFSFSVGILGQICQSLWSLGERRASALSLQVSIWGVGRAQQPPYLLSSASLYVCTLIVPIPLFFYKGASPPQFLRLLWTNYALLTPIFRKTYKQMFVRCH